MNIQIITLRVDDWAQMVTYYRDQIGLAMKFADEDNQYAMFDTGPVRLAIEGSLRPAFAKRPGRPGVMVNFQVDDLVCSVEGLRDRSVELLTDARHGPGYDYVAMTDPEGNEHIVFQRAARP
jgi:predicted enzyme related to lactoylglutathione lyase